MYKEEDNYDDDTCKKAVDDDKDVEEGKKEEDHKKEKGEEIEIGGCFI